MIRQWIDKLLEDLRRVASRITSMDEILLGVILALVLLIILTSLGFFD